MIPNAICNEVSNDNNKMFPYEEAQFLGTSCSDPALVPTSPNAIHSRPQKLRLRFERWSHQHIQKLVRNSWPLKERSHASGNKPSHAAVPQAQSQPNVSLHLSFLSVFSCQAPQRRTRPPSASTPTGPSTSSVLTPQWHASNAHNMAAPVTSRPSQTTTTIFPQPPASSTATSPPYPTARTPSSASANVPSSPL